MRIIPGLRFFVWKRGRPVNWVLYTLPTILHFKSEAKKAVGGILFIVFRTGLVFTPYFKALQSTLSSWADTDKIIYLYRIKVLTYVIGNGRKAEGIC